MFTLTSRLFLAAALLLANFSAQADVWAFRSDAWCPYNCEPDSEYPGYMVEILQGAARANDHQLDYQLLPYTRALKEAQEGRITGIVAMLAQDRKGLLFSQQMGVDSNCLFVNSGSQLKYQSPADFDTLGRVGIILGYGYPDDYNQWSARHTDKVEALSGEEVLVRQARKLTLHRIGAFIENENVFRYASNSSTELKYIELAGCMIGGDPIFIGLSTRNPNAHLVKAQIDAYFDTIRKKRRTTHVTCKVPGCSPEVIEARGVGVSVLGGATAMARPGSGALQKPVTHKGAP